jgi:dienelactone hydrolase
LRVDFSNMEIAAAAAPRPQILVAATGDWTKATMTMEGPAIESIYRLFGAADKLRYVRFDYDHNYNQTSRQAVYEWFGKWLLRHENPASLKELAYTKEPDEALRVWPDGKLPSDALNETRLIENLIHQAKAQRAALWPADEATLARFKDAMRPAWQHTLHVELPENGLIIDAGKTESRDGFSEAQLHIGRNGKGDRLPVILLSPKEDQLRLLVVLAHTNGIAAFHKDGKPRGLASALLRKGCSVVLLDTFLTGSLQDSNVLASRNHFSNFFSTYNRTDLQERVQDLITACAFARVHGKGRRIVLCGQGRSGLWAMLAAPAADAVVAEGANLDLSTDAVLMQQDLFVPGLRRLGAFETAVALASPNPFLGHATGTVFNDDLARDTYAAAKRANALRLEPTRLKDAEIADWITGIKWQ